MTGFLARPTATGAVPGVLVGFEMFGLTGYVRRVTEHVARLGFVALAPDFYHRAGQDIELEATDDGRQRGLRLAHDLGREQALADVRAAMSALRERTSGKVGMVGFS